MAKKKIILNPKVIKSFFHTGPQNLSEILGDRCVLEYRLFWILERYHGTYNVYCVARTGTVHIIKNISISTAKHIVN